MPVSLPRAFRHLAFANLAAQSAEQIMLAAAPLVAVLAFGAGAGEAGLLQTILTLPFVIVAIPAGLLADRHRRSRVMAWAELARAAMLAAIMLLWLGGLLSLGALALLGFVAVGGTVVFSVAAPALVPSLVGSDALPLANARLELARTIAFAGGPALGGALVGFTGVGPAFLAATLLSLVAAGLLWRIEDVAPAPSATRDVLRDIREGAAFVISHPLLAPVFATQTLFNIGMFAMFAIFVPHAVETLGLSAQGVGIVLGCYGIGMVAGALAAPALMGHLRFGTMIAIGPLTGFCASLLMAATAHWPSPALAAISLVLFGAGPILWVVATATLRQSVTPPALLGRVSAMNILTYGARPIGAGIGALAASLAGTGAALAIAACFFAAQAVTILASPARRLQDRPVLA